MDLDDFLYYDDPGEYRLHEVLKREIGERREEAAELRRQLAAAEEREARLVARLDRLERRLPNVLATLSDLVDVQVRAVADPGPALARALIRRAVPALTGADPVPGATAAWPTSATDFVRMADRLPDVDDWALAAARGLAELLTGDEDDGLRHVAEAEAAERAGTGCFLTLAFIAADRAQDAARWLPLVFADLTWQSVPQPSQRAVWELAAAGAAGPAGVREVVAWLTEVAAFAQPPRAAVTETDWVGLGAVAGVAADGAASVPDVLAVGEPAAAAPLEAADRLAGLYELCRNAALGAGDGKRHRESAAAALMALLQGADTVRRQATEEMRRAVEVAFVPDDAVELSTGRGGGAADTDLGGGGRPGWARAAAVEGRPREQRSAVSVRLPVIDLVRSDLFGTALGLRQCGPVALRAAAPVIAAYAEVLRGRVAEVPPLDVEVDLGRGVTLIASDEHDPAVGEALAQVDEAVDAELADRSGLFGRRPSADATQQPKKRARARVNRAFAVRTAYVAALADARTRADDHYRTLLDLLGRTAENVGG